MIIVGLLFVSLLVVGGVYVVRISHPRYAADVHRVQVLSRQTVEIRATLHAGTSSPIVRAVNDGVRAFRKALRF